MYGKKCLSQNVCTFNVGHYKFKLFQFVIYSFYCRHSKIEAIQKRSVFVFHITVNNANMFLFPLNKSNNMLDFRFCWKCCEFDEMQNDM